MLICEKPRIFDVDLCGFAAILVMAAATWFAVIKPLEAKTADMLEQRDESLERRQMSQGELNRLQTVSQEQQQLATRLSRTPDILAENPGTADVLRRLEEIANSTGLMLEEVIPQETDVAQHFSNTPLACRFTGTFPQLHSFLDTTRTSMRYVRVAGLSVERQASDQTGLCDVGLDLHVFAR